MVHAEVGRAAPSGDIRAHHPRLGRRPNVSSHLALFPSGVIREMLDAYIVCSNGMHSSTRR
jgi:hypothetical protein